MRETGWAWVAQLVERVLGKDEVTGSSPVNGSRFRVVAVETPQPKVAVAAFGSRKEAAAREAFLESRAGSSPVNGSSSIPVDNPDRQKQAKEGLAWQRKSLIAASRT